MLSAVVFDLDDTLYDYVTLDRAATEALCRFARHRLGMDEEAFRAAYAQGRRETKSQLGNTAASHNRLLYCQRTLERLGLPPAELALEMYEVYWGCILDAMRPTPGAPELLARCREAGLKVGICSDLTAHIQHRKLKRLGLDSLVDVLVTSEEAGVEKPGAAIYRLLLEKLELPPENVLFVGDSLERDVIGPQAAGMRAVWFRGTAGRGYAVAATMEEVEGIIHGAQ